MNKVYSIVLEKILNAMESGVVPWQSPYVLQGHQNISGREYRGMNVLLLNIESMVFGYELPVWLTFRQAKEKGWHVRRGEHAHVVTFFKKIEVKKKTKKIEIDEDEIETEVETKQEAEAEAKLENETATIPCLRYYKVFNIQQLVEYEEIKKDFLVQAHVENDDILNAYIENSGVIFETKNWGTSCYVPRLDKIEMAPVKTEYLQTLAHEIIHSTGHPKRLGRFNIDDVTVDRVEYSQEELVAEIGSSFLLARIGETPSYQNSASYIAGWARYLKENKKTAIFRAASQAQKACEYVLKVAGAAEEVKKAA